jgi:peptidoglycan/xylan/chitin deacetylase (PgdA/CDA1 family)
MVDQVEFPRAMAVFIPAISLRLVLLTLLISLGDTYVEAADSPIWRVPAAPNGGKPCKNGQHYKVSLSFDDGPHPTRTVQVLDTLKEKNVKATFFVLSDHFPSIAAGKPPTESEKQLVDILRRVQDEGHTIGSHSYHHEDHVKPRASDLPPMVNLETNDKVLKSLNLKKDGMPFRFPHGKGWAIRPGEINKAVMQEIKNEHFVPIHWDIDSLDWSAIKRKALPDSLLDQICSHGSGIILMHDIQAFESSGNPSNLANIIDWIRNSGHKIVPLDEIRHYRSPILGQLPSLSDQATDPASCPGLITKGDFDSVWPSCEQYKNFSNDHANDKTAPGASQ